MMHGFLIARLTASFSSSSTQIQLGSLLPHYAALFFNAFSSSGSSFESQPQQKNHHEGHTFTVSYLINTCGVSPDWAVKLSETIKLKNTNRPNAVLDLLKNYGFSQTHLSILVKKCPKVLLANPEKTLLPKLKFFGSIGFSVTDLPTVLSGNVNLLLRSLKNSIIPRYKIIRSLVCSDKKVVSTLKHGPRFFTSCNIINDSVPNIKVLKQLGVPQGSISLLVTNFPSVAFMKHSRFVEIVMRVKEMEFDPMKTYFVLAIQVLAKMDNAAWELKLEVFERWGWSRDTCLSAFKKYPQCMMVSEKKIMKTLSFLANDMGWPSEDIARYPSILNRNLETTFIPRCAVVKILKSRGLIKNNASLSTFILISEKTFLERYVTRFQKNVPLLLGAYKGHNELRLTSWCC